MRKSRSFLDDLFRSVTGVGRTPGRGPVFKRIGAGQLGAKKTDRKKFAIVGRRGQTDQEISDKMVRLALRQEQVRPLVKVSAAASGKSLGAARDQVGGQLKSQMRSKGGSIGGTIAKGKKGSKSYISRNLAKKDSRFKKKGINLRNVVHHEGFHTIPGVGHSEIAAHFTGGLRGTKGKVTWAKGADGRTRAVKRATKLSPLQGLKDVGHLAVTRPGRFAGEVAIGAGAIAGGKKVVDDVKARREYRKMRG